MREKLNIIFFGVALAVMLAVVILPADEKAADAENRAMEAFPELSGNSYISGEFSARLEAFLSDNTSNRTTWLTFAHILENSHGLRLPNTAVQVTFNASDLGIGLIPDGCAACNFGELSCQDEQHLEALPLGEQSQESTPINVINLGAVNTLIPFSIDVNFNENAVFYLRFTEERELAARYAEVLNEYRRALPENARMFSLISPVKVEFMGERYAAVNSSQAEAIGYINGLLHEDIATVDAYGGLSKHADEYIFFRTDHHWTMLGAYYAYLAFAETASFVPITLERYTEYAIEGFVGSLAVGTRNRAVLSHPDTIYFYRLNDGTQFSMEIDGTQFSVEMFTIPASAEALSYRVFLGGDRGLFEALPLFSDEGAVSSGEERQTPSEQTASSGEQPHTPSEQTASSGDELRTPSEKRRTLVVVKDSFANAMLPFVVPHYERVVIVDPRQFVGSVTELVQGLGNDVDVLFLNYIPATAMAELIGQIDGVR
ncbi:MAG: DHHW family protein [Defluviitaleaceae bacterium]|nr:DHHW family protein [Defluviitaleaceae bacterium]